MILFWNNYKIYLIAGRYEVCLFPQKEIKEPNYVEMMT